MAEVQNYALATLVAQRAPRQEAEAVCVVWVFGCFQLMGRYDPPFFSAPPAPSLRSNLAKIDNTLLRPSAQGQALSRVIGCLK
jgi:hypothetical protein